MENMLLVVVLMGLCAIVTSQATTNTNCTQETSKCSDETKRRFTAAGGVLSMQCNALYHGLTCLETLSSGCTDLGLTSTIADARKDLDGLSCQGPTTVTVPAVPVTTMPKTRAISRWGGPNNRGNGGRYPTRHGNGHAYGSVSCVTNSILVLLSAFVLSTVF